MRKLLIILMLLSSGTLFGGVTLEQCYQLAEKNYPLTQNIKYYGKMAELQQSNHNTKYYPQLNLFGTAKYQSEATSLSLGMEIPGFTAPTVPLGQYSFGISIDQLVWDGGISSNREKFDKLSYLTEAQTAVTDIYSVRQRINDSFFNILLLTERKRILKLTITDLENNLQIIGSRVKNGVLLQSNADIIEAELLGLRQNLDELNAMIKTAKEILAGITGNDEILNDTLVDPALNFSETDNTSGRPEFGLFDLQKGMYELRKDLASSFFMPKVSIYGQLAAGRPGLNMFSDEIKPFYQVGINASWNLWNWGQASREKEIYSIRQMEIEQKAKTLDLNINNASYKNINNIKMLEKQIEKDAEIVRLRDRIVRQSLSQLTNGIITSTQYMHEFTMKVKAVFDMNIRKLQIEYEKASYMTLIGSRN